MGITGEKQNEKGFRKCILNSFINSSLVANALWQSSKASLALLTSLLLVTSLTKSANVQVTGLSFGLLLSSKSVSIALKGEGFFREWEREELEEFPTPPCKWEGNEDDSSLFTKRPFSGDSNLPILLFTFFAFLFSLPRDVLLPFSTC